MKMIVTTGLVVLFAFFQQSPLKEYRWKNRLVLVFGEGANSPSIKKKQALFTKVEQDREERQIKIIYVLPNICSVENPSSEIGLNPNKVRDYFGVDENFEGVILVGKDGGEKYRKQGVVAPQQIFDLIDGMPMRQAEMKKG